jgi:hypothetical protein
VPPCLKNTEAQHLKAGTFTCRHHKSPQTLVLCSSGVVLANSRTELGPSNWLWLPV